MIDKILVLIKKFLLKITLKAIIIPRITKGKKILDSVIFFIFITLAPLQLFSLYYARLYLFLLTAQ